MCCAPREVMAVPFLRVLATEPARQEPRYVLTEAQEPGR